MKLDVIWPVLVLSSLVSCGGSTPASSGGLGGSGSVTSGSGGSGGTGGSGAVTSGAGGGTGGAAACDQAIDAVIASGCQRCWPAFRALCSEGNATVVQGLLACLTHPNMCWDVGDPNTAIPCMADVVDTNANGDVDSVEATLTSLGCGHDAAVEAGAYAAALSDADRATFASCISAATSCSDPLFTSCLAKTSLDPSKCVD